MDESQADSRARLSRRTLLQGLVGLAALPLLAACGSTATTPAASSSAAPAASGSAKPSTAASAAPGSAAPASAVPAASAAASSAGAAAGSGGAGNLTFWVISSFTPNPDAAIFKAAQQYTTQNPNVKVTVESTAASGMRDKLVTAVKGGQGPDIVSVDSAWVAGLAAAEIMQVIDDKIAPIKGDFFPGPLQTGAYLGKQYALPWYTNNVALFWNKKLFQAAGLSAAPTTWQELVDTGKKLTSGDKYGLMLGAKGFGAFLWFPFAWQNGATLISDDGKTAQFGNDAGKEAWQFYSDLYLTQKIVPDALKSATTSWDQLFAPFIQEKVAMMMTGDWGISAVKGGNANLDFGIAPLPKGKQAATVIGGYDLAIPKTSKQADAAWAFLKWFTAKEQESVLQSYNRIQARQDIIGSEYANKDPLIKVFIDQSGAGRARATVPQWDEIENTILADAWDSVTLGQAKAADALATAVKKANDLLKG